MSDIAATIEIADPRLGDFVASDHDEAISTPRIGEPVQYGDRVIAMPVRPSGTEQTTADVCVSVMTISSFIRISSTTSSRRPGAYPYRRRFPATSPTSRGVRSGAAIRSRKDAAIRPVVMSCSDPRNSTAPCSCSAPRPAVWLAATEIPSVGRPTQHRSSAATPPAPIAISAEANDGDAIAIYMQFSVGT